MSEPVVDVKTVAGTTQLSRQLLEDFGLTPMTWERRMERFGYATTGNTPDRTLAHSENRYCYPHDPDWDSQLRHFIADWVDDLSSWPRRSDD